MSDFWGVYGFFAVLFTFGWVVAVGALTYDAHERCTYFYRQKVRAQLRTTLWYGFVLPIYPVLVLVGLFLLSRFIYRTAFVDND